LAKISFVEYEDLCEGMWRDWADGKREALSDWNHLCKSLRLSLDHCPEPYLTLTPGKKPLVFVTTNPGGEMDFQLRRNIPSRLLGGDYNVMAEILPRLYGQDGLSRFSESDGWIGGSRIGASASTRLCKMRDLAAKFGSEGAIQVELIPFHSGSLRNKAKAASLAEDSAWAAYRTSLKSFLADKDVLAFGATGVLEGNPKDSPWLRLVLDTIGLDAPPNWERPAADKSNWLSTSRREGRLKAVHLMNSGNNLPSDIRLLAENLKR
jgi:hypothetical protein